MERERQTRFAAALKEVKRVVVEFVRERGKKLQGFFRLSSRKLQGQRQEGNRVFFFFRIAEFPSGIADKRCSSSL
jgi:hypothetical protein